MKNLLILIGALATFTSKAQYPLEHTFTDQAGTPSIVVFTSNGKKFVTRDTSSTQLHIFDMNYSLWKTINIPPVANYAVSSFQLSDNLFNLDNAVEVVVNYYNSNDYTYKTKVINETGSVIWDLGDVYWAYTMKDDNDVYKMMTVKYHINGNGAAVTYSTSIYTLPGSLPCDGCGFGLGVKNINSNSNNVFLSEPVPNPAMGETMITYMLNNNVTAGELQLYNVAGQMLKSYPTSGSSGSVKIATTDYAAGTYYYSLKTSTELTPAKKLVIMK